MPATCAKNALSTAATALAFPEDYYVGLRSRYAEARVFILDLLRRTGFRCFEPLGAYYIIADMADLMGRLEVGDDVAFSRKLIDRAGVAAAFARSWHQGRRPVAASAEALGSHSPSLDAA